MSSPSNDALAQVAVGLALRSRRLDATNDLDGTFWFFYRRLVATRDYDERREAREAEESADPA